MTTKEAFKALCNQRGALTKSCRIAGNSHPGKRSAEIRWRIKHKKMWPQQATMFQYLVLAGWKLNQHNEWEKD